MSYITIPTPYDQVGDYYAAFRRDTPSNLSAQESYGQPVHIDPRYPIQPEADPTLHRSRFHEMPSAVKYDTYDVRAKGIGEYKYNLYSILDEPWNRCCQVGACGNCPGNQCIAKRTPKLDWL